MRRSFGGNHGGGGGGGSGNMLRSLARTVSRTGAGGSSIQEPFSSSSSHTKTIKTPTSPKTKHNNNLLSLSSPPSSAAANNSHFSPYVITSPTAHRSWHSPTSSVCDDFDWVCVDDGASEDDVSRFDDFVLGPVPSRHEAQSAVTALQQVIETSSFSQFVRDKYGTSTETDVPGRAVSPTSFNHSTASGLQESDWAEPSLQLCDTRVLQSRSSGTVYDAFHLLQTDPSVQRMVISLSSDPAVWNAVLNNEAVQELRQFISPDDDNISTASLETDSDDSEEVAASILKWIFNNTKAKVMEIIELISNLVSDLFQPPETDHKPSTTSTDSFEGKLRYSLMLTVVVLLIVSIARVKRA